VEDEGGHPQSVDEEDRADRAACRRRQEAGDERARYDKILHSMQELILAVWKVEYFYLVHLGITTYE
jgi:hypothetical protein